MGSKDPQDRGFPFPNSPSPFTNQKDKLGDGLLGYPLPSDSQETNQTPGSSSVVLPPSQSTRKNFPFPYGFSVGDPLSETRVYEMDESTFSLQQDWSEIPSVNVGSPNSNRENLHPQRLANASEDVGTNKSPKQSTSTTDPHSGETDDYSLSSILRTWVSYLNGRAKYQAAAANPVEIGDSSRSQGPSLPQVLRQNASLILEQPQEKLSLPPPSLTSSANRDGSNNVKPSDLAQPTKGMKPTKATGRRGNSKLQALSSWRKRGNSSDRLHGSSSRLEIISSSTSTGGMSSSTNMTTAQEQPIPAVADQFPYLNLNPAPSFPDGSNNPVSSAHPSFDHGGTNSTEYNLPLDPVNSTANDAPVVVGADQENPNRELHDESKNSVQKAETKTECVSSLEYQKEESDFGKWKELDIPSFEEQDDQLDPVKWVQQRYMGMGDQNDPDTWP